jgi:hypothetical protein
MMANAAAPRTSTDRTGSPIHATHVDEIQRRKDPRGRRRSPASCRPALATNAASACSSTWRGQRGSPIHPGRRTGADNKHGDPTASRARPGRRPSVPAFHRAIGRRTLPGPQVRVRSACLVRATRHRQTQRHDGPSKLDTGRRRSRRQRGRPIPADRYRDVTRRAGGR